MPEASGTNTLGVLLRVFPEFFAVLDFDELDVFAELPESWDCAELALLPEALADELAATGLSTGALPAVALSPEQAHSRALDRHKMHRDNEIDLCIIRHSPCNFIVGKTACCVLGRCVGVFINGV